MSYKNLLSLKIVLSSAFLMLSSLSASFASTQDSVQFIDKLGREAIETLTNGSMDQASIESQFLTLLNDHFDVASISNFVLGRYRRTATAAQKQEFQTIFVNRLKKAYANRFKEFKGVKFSIKNGREQSNYHVITSIIQKPSGPEIQVEWWTKNKKIHDVVVDGISMRSTLRDDYNASIANHGGNIDLFISELKKLR